ncbi:DUF2213 domain-containing protein [Basilea psittacipulmonis]|uniref:DUF2213 domain-containing protein n=1 Tax=Basilea psittacipulmonis TaxID=1472345 RepID=UPI0006919056|nr:DUF2213 domain-containing protein [Basilea psittacipulmonis]
MNIVDSIERPSERVYTQDGYLIANAKLSKLGTFDYLHKELDPDVKTGGEEIKRVKRSEYSLFTDETIKSFEGLPITLGHPQDKRVNSKNWKELAVGTVRNVKREGDYLTAQAYIYDENAIKTIQEHGIKELSCGYACEVIPSQDKDADYELTPMIGNHVALVANGRCGSTCTLADEDRPMSILQKVLKKLGVELTDEQAKRLQDAEADATKDENEDGENKQAQASQDPQGTSEDDNTKEDENAEDKQDIET